MSHKIIKPEGIELIEYLNNCLLYTSLTIISLIDYVWKNKQVLTQGGM